MKKSSPLWSRRRRRSTGTSIQEVKCVVGQRVSVSVSVSVSKIKISKIIFKCKVSSTSRVHCQNLYVANSYIPEYTTCTSCVFLVRVQLFDFIWYKYTNVPLMKV